MGDYKVADISLADFGRKEIELAEFEMPGLMATRAEYGTEALVAPTDVTDESAVEALVDGAVEAFGGLDVVVNNAGLGRGSGVEGLSTEDYRTMMDVNVDGCFFTTRATLPHLRETEGNLVFIGSFAGQYPRPSNPVYAATKWWLRGFALSVSAAVGESGIAVSVVNPSEVRTEFGGEESFEGEGLCRPLLGEFICPVCRRLGGCRHRHLAV